jgi:DNA-binding XRE family transcriptional regulator
MSKSDSKQYPFRTLGFKLRSLREKEKETIPDVSGAVEIDAELLVEIETGSKLPSEDILLLLISHFGLQNEDAMKLWRLAGYDDLTDQKSSISSESLNQQSAVFLLPIDSRVVYTDQVQVSLNNFGIVVNFQQNSSQTSSHPLTVARVGMSREHAESMISILQQVLKGGEARKSNKNTKNVIKDKAPKDKNKSSETKEAN